MSLLKTSTALLAVALAVTPGARAQINVPPQAQGPDTGQTLAPDGSGLTLPAPSRATTPAPAPEAARPSASRPAAPKSAKATPATPGNPIADWQIEPAKNPNGSLNYCAIEDHFDNHLALVMARSPAGETNLAIGMPGAKMPKGAGWQVHVTVDGKTSRDSHAVAVEADLAVISFGKDEPLVEAFRKGHQLIIEGPSDKAAFILKGTGKAVADLRSCIKTGGASAAAAPGKPVPFPAPLRAILQSAGIKPFEPLSMTDMPQEKRPADFAWRYGPVFGGVRERRAPPDRDFESLTQGYLDSLKTGCPGAFDLKHGAIETLPGATLQTADVSCVGTDGKITLMMVFYQTPEHVFTVIFHEAKDPDIATATQARDSIAKVIRQLAATPAEAAAPASPPAPATPAAPAP
ncbi:MAG: hypothetical protein P4M00_11390 [Azospirillaceae bacterium]|nr:hypothetical protein [Azospirillaceae bacterium]